MFVACLLCLYVRLTFVVCVCIYVCCVCVTLCVFNCLFICLFVGFFRVRVRMRGSLRFVVVCCRCRCCCCCCCVALSRQRMVCQVLSRILSRLYYEWIMKCLMRYILRARGAGRHFSEIFVEYFLRRTHENRLNFCIFGNFWLYKYSNNKIIIIIKNTK